MCAKWIHRCCSVADLQCGCWSLFVSLDRLPDQRYRFLGLPANQSLRKALVARLVRAGGVRRFQVTVQHLWGMTETSPVGTIGGAKVGSLRKDQGNIWYQQFGTSDGP